jgi:hypothetical protein
MPEGTPTLVVNMRGGTQYDIYIGRPSKWGNPYSHLPTSIPGVTRVATREEAVDRYRIWIKAQPRLVASLHELKGKILGCHCSEYVPCHGHVLAEMADAL